MKTMLEPKIVAARTQVSPPCARSAVACECVTSSSRGSSEMPTRELPRGPTDPHILAGRGWRLCTPVTAYHPFRLEEPESVHRVNIDRESSLDSGRIRPL